MTGSKHREVDWSLSFVTVECMSENFSKKAKISQPKSMTRMLLADNQSRVVILEYIRLFLFQVKTQLKTWNLCLWKWNYFLRVHHGAVKMKSLYRELNTKVIYSSFALISTNPADQHKTLLCLQPQVIYIPCQGFITNYLNNFTYFSHDSTLIMVENASVTQYPCCTLLLSPGHPARSHF